MHFYIKLVTCCVVLGNVNSLNSEVVYLLDRGILAEGKLEWTWRGLAGPRCRSHSTCL